MSDIAPPPAGSPWTTPAEVREQVGRRLWDSGLLLAEQAGAAPVFPYRVRLRRPKPADLLARYAEARQWVRDLNAMPEVRIEWGTAGDRTVGRNELPARLWIDDADAACRLIGTDADLGRFRQLVAVTAQRTPAVVPWMARYPLEALRAEADWERLLDVVRWIGSHPQPGIYLRQVDLPGVDTKFIETNRLLLASMLDAVLPVAAYVAAASPLSAFARRYGFRAPPATVALRTLDRGAALQLDDGSSLAVGERAVTLTIDDFARLTAVERLFVTENHVNFLAFPPVTGAVVVFGQGYDVGKIAQAGWVHDIPVHYWGDIDTYGFAILDYLRSLLPNVRSLLMTRETLSRHAARWVVEDRPVRRDLAHLVGDERQLYEDLRDNRLGDRVRLEQELIGYAWVETAVRTACATERHAPPRC